MRDTADNVVPFDDKESFYDLFEARFELGSEFSTRECELYNEADSSIICRVRALVPGTQIFEIVSLAEIGSFKDTTVSVTVLPSLIRHIGTDQVTVTTISNGDVTLTMSIEDAYGN